MVYSFVWLKISFLSFGEKNAHWNIRIQEWGGERKKKPWRRLDVSCTHVNHHHRHRHHHHISVMELGHLLTRSCLTYTEVSSKVYHDSYCQLGSSVSLPRVIYFEAFYLHVVSSFSCIPVNVCTLPNSTGLNKLRMPFGRWIFMQRAEEK